MADTLEDLQKKALQLSEAERGRLAAALIQSLPGVLYDEDEGFAEADRRYAELKENPSIGISLAELDAAVRNRLG